MIKILHIPTGHYLHLEDQSHFLIVEDESVWFKLLYTQESMILDDDGIPRFLYADSILGVDITKFNLNKPEQVAELTHTSISSNTTSGAIITTGGIVNSGSVLMSTGTSCVPTWKLNDSYQIGNSNKSVYLGNNVVVSNYEDNTRIPVIPHYFELIPAS